MPQVNPAIATWQSEDREIGMVEFAPSDTATDRFPYYSLPDDATFIGAVEADALCLQIDDSLCVYDNASRNRILCPAAVSQPCFVKAMKELEQHFDKCDADDLYCGDLDAAEAVRDRCVNLAGGNEYVPFFTSMLGV
jgi:hypothetical protein